MWYNIGISSQSEAKGESDMRQLPTQAGHPRRGTSPWVAWVATIAVAVVLLVVIVIAATTEGIRIRVEMWELEVLRTHVPAREAVYPESIPAPPTVITAPQVSEEVSGLEAPFASLARDTDLRSGPGTKYAITKKHLAAGQRVQLLTSPIDIQEQQWQQVKTAEGQVGWCMTSDLIPVSVE
jgi:uncharacterized protein YgiM (DUF1202 family)